MLRTRNTEALAWAIRRHAVEMTCLGKSSHIGAVLSEADILAVLYGGVLRVDPDRPKDQHRDRFILSKGHAGAGVYAALAECGFFPAAELRTHYRDGSRLSGHVSHKGIPGVEVSTGSLGHGLPLACGMALSARLNGERHFVYTLLGDGECDEGSNWEAALIARHHGLSRLIIIIDHNRMQSLDTCENTLSLEPFDDKFRAFGLKVLRTDGHDHRLLKEAFETARRNGEAGGAPTVIIAETVKGKGVSFMENSILWHYRTPQGEEYAAAVAELEASKP
jgi:transketolase